MLAGAACTSLGARAKHAVLVRLSSTRLTQRAAYFSDGPTRHHRSWPTPRPRWGFLPKAPKGYNSAPLGKFAFLVEKRTCRMWHVDFAIFTHLCSDRKAKRVRDCQPIANCLNPRKCPHL